MMLLSFYPPKALAPRASPPALTASPTAPALNVAVLLSEVELLQVESAA